jgi:hypothetical protein
LLFRRGWASSKKRIGTNEDAKSVNEFSFERYTDTFHVTCTTLITFIVSVVDVVIASTDENKIISCVLRQRDKIIRRVSNLFILEKFLRTLITTIKSISQDRLAPFACLRTSDW